MAKTLEEVKAEYLSAAKNRQCGAWVVKDPETGAVVANSAAKFRHSFDGGASWVEAQQRTTDLYRSADGKYYEESTLPEQTDEFCTERYAKEMRSERNARIADTDKYAQLSDVTVLKTAKSKREALTDEERQSVLTYREQLRDLPEQSGWPFVDFPTVPTCVAVEVNAKIALRVANRNMYRRTL